MIDEKKLINYIKAEINPYGKPFNDTAYEFGLKLIDHIKAMEAQPQVDGWTPVTERLPNMEEYLENDGRFILDDGNRRYQGLFDIYDKKFKCSKHLSGLSYELIEDNCVIAWQSLPEPYEESEEE